MNAAIITNNIVNNVIVIESQYMADYAATLPEGTILILSDIAAITDIYDPNTGEFSKAVQNA